MLVCLPRFIKWLCVTLCLSLGGTACKPQASSSTKSLENLTRDTGVNATVNICGPNQIPAALNIPEIRASITGGDTNSVLQALGAAPEIMLQLFFAVGGEVQLSATLPDVCKTQSTDEQLFFGERSDNAQSCWIKKPGMSPVIYVINSPEVIRHGLLRSLSYIYSGPMADGFRRSNPEQVQVFDTNINALGEAFIGVIKANPNGSTETLLNLAQRSRQFFNRVVFAETVDSLYCNPNTYVAVASPSSPYRPVFDAFSAKDQAADSLANELGVPWFGPNALVVPVADPEAAAAAAAAAAEQPQTAPMNNQLPQ